MVIRTNDVLGLVAHFPKSGRFRVGEEFPFVHSQPGEGFMVAPETNEIAIGWRLIGMTARIHAHEPPEMIAAEARTAKDELESCAPGVVRHFADEAADRLIGYASAPSPEARFIAEHLLADATGQLRKVIGIFAGKEA